MTTHLPALKKIVTIICVVVFVYDGLQIAGAIQKMMKAPAVYSFKVPAEQVRAYSDGGGKPVIYEIDGVAPEQLGFDAYWPSWSSMMVILAFHVILLAWVCWAVRSTVKAELAAR